MRTRTHVLSLETESTSLSTLGAVEIMGCMRDTGQLCGRPASASRTTVVGARLLLGPVAAADLANRTCV